MKLLRALLAPALLACALTAAGARDGPVLAAAPAAGPGLPLAPLPRSDLTFLVTADNATLKAKESTLMLKLKGTALTVPYITSGKRVKLLPTGSFANSSLGSPLLTAGGQWLDAPQALVYGTSAGGNLSSLVMALDGVRFDAATRWLKFNVTAVAPALGELKLADGPVEAAIKDSAQGVGPKLLTEVTPNTTWTGVTVVIESTRTALRQAGETKFFGWGGWGWGRPWGGYYGGPWWGK